MPGTEDEARISLYADDATAVVCNELSVSKIFLLSELYGMASGARLNEKKCQGILMGSLTKYIFFYNQFNWAQESTKICGAYFYSTDTTEYNWNKIAVKIRATKIHNQFCHLTFLGKALYINKYILSKVWYIAKTFRMTQAFITCINLFVREFVWQKTPPLLSWRTLIRTPEDGGINLVHVESRANAFIIQHLYKFMSLASLADQRTNLAFPKWFFFTRYWIGL